MSQSGSLMGEGGKMAVPSHVSGVSHLSEKISPFTSAVSASQIRRNVNLRATVGILRQRTILGSCQRRTMYALNT